MITRALPLAAAFLVAGITAAPIAAPTIAAGTGAAPTIAAPTIAAGHTTLIAPAATAPDSTVEWSVAPADAAGEDGRISLRHVLDPGTAITDNIAITNHGASASEFTVQAGDGVVGANGAFDIAEGVADDSGAWIRIDGLDDERVVIAAGETRVLPVTITAPTGATPGDHPAGIVVGVTRADDGVTVRHRIGVRVHLQIAGDLAASLAVTETHSSFTPSWIPFAPGTLTVDVDLENTGNVRVGAAPVVAAAGLFGVAGTRAAEPVVELLPGDSTHQQVQVQAWPLAALFGAVTVTPSSIGSDSIPLPDAVTADFTTLAVSWTALALIALLVIIVIVWRRRRAAASADARTTSSDDALTTPSDDALTTPSENELTLSAR